VARPSALGDDTTILDEVGDGGPSPRIRERSKLFGRIAGTKFSPQPVGSVTNSVEMQRILALPRRVLDLDRVEDITHIFRKPGGKMSLRPIQCAALIEAAYMQGLFAPIPVGYGKELVSFLMPTALDSKRAVLLVPPALRRQVDREMREVYGRHFEIPPLTVVSYTELSSQTKADILEKLKPDLIIANECHAIRYKTAARTKRFLRYMREHPECRFVGLSGTITSRSIKDYSHLIELALRKSSPLPRGYREVMDWAGAIDVKPEYVMKPGALAKFCAEGESVRDGYSRRLIQSKGVITTSRQEIGASLILRKCVPSIPKRVLTVLLEIKNAWSVEGNAFSDILTQTAYLKQVACGFYYLWDWPGGVPDYEWLSARSAWQTVVGEKLKGARPGLDSPGFLALAADRWLKGKREGTVWNCPEWEPWKAVKDRPEPPKKTIWIDDFLCRDAFTRAQEHAKTGAPCIIWVEHKAIGAKLAEISGLPYYGQGTDASPTKHDVLLASRRVQGTGKNLQHHYSTNVFTALCSGAEMEQAIGRTHRLGQLRDEVLVDWYAHTPECEGAMEKARADARYQESTLNQRQKLCYGQYVDTDD
jgi:hypothetical protein